MKIPKTKLAIGIAMMLTFPNLAFAQGFYLSAQLGVSQQANDSEPYGNNIAVDADFPGEFDAGDSAVGGISIGYVFNDRFRLEGRFSYRDSSFNESKFGSGTRNGEEYILNGKIKSTSFTLEGFYDFPNNSTFTPYLKAGIGVSENSYSARLGGAGVAAFDPFDGVVDGYYDEYEDGDSTEFSWNVGIGGNVEFSERTSIYGEYQYASFGDVRTGQDSFTDGFKIDDIAAHEFIVGIRIKL